MSPLPATPAATLEDLVSACEGDLGGVPAARSTAAGLAAEVGGELALRWEIVELRAAMASPPDDDTIRERYGELVDRHRDAPAHLARLRALGDEIRALEEAGVLPSSLVVRAPRKPR
jgi:hypothetical protein